MNAPRTAVVTLTRARDAHLHRHRQGLAGAPVCRHIVVGMGEWPTPRTVPGAPPLTPATVPVPPEGLPLAAARNAGAALAMAAGAELLIFLDVDCIPGPALVQRYQQAARDTDGGAVLLCGPVAYLPPPPPSGYPDGQLHQLAAPHSARPAPPPGPPRFDDRFELFWSLSFAVSSHTWRRLGGFDERYRGYGGEDTDFALRAAATGAQLAWVGGAVAYHQFHPPARHAPARVAEMVRNAHMFHRRHGFYPMSDWFAELAQRGIVEFDPARGRLRLPGEPVGAARAPREPRSAGEVERRADEPDSDDQADSVVIVAP